MCANIKPFSILTLTLFRQLFGLSTVLFLYEYSVAQIHKLSTLDRPLTPSTIESSNGTQKSNIILFDNDIEQLLSFVPNKIKTPINNI